MPKVWLNKNKYKLIFIVTLTLVGALMMTIRQSATHVDAVPVGDRIWKLAIDTRFNITRDSSTLNFFLPSDTPFAKVVRQTLTHPKTTLKRPERQIAYNNKILAVADGFGEHQLLAEFIVHASDHDRWTPKPQRKQELTTQQRVTFLDDANTMRLNDPLITDALSNIRAGVADLSSMVQEIYLFVYDQIVLVPDISFSDVPDVLSQMRGNALGKTTTFVALCRASNIPARLVAGIKLEESIGAELHYWAEVFADEQWQPFDVELGFAGEIPTDLLPVAFDSESIAYFDDATPLETNIDIETVPAFAGTMGKETKNLIQIIDLTRLTIPTQHMLAVLLILPFGALLTQLFRQVIGVNTFGIFSASLLALAMVYADWITVVVIVLVVGIFGMAGRAFLVEGMTRVSRLVIVFTLVAMSMAFAVSLMEFFNMKPSANAILLPIVILVTLIDRVYATQEERGMLVTLYRIAWTAVVALFCYLLFKLEWLRHLVLLHPEVHLFTLALVLLVSLYNKPTLMELELFKLLREPASRKKNGSTKNKETVESI